MTASTAPVSRAARDLLGMVRDLPDMDDAELAHVEDVAARAFTRAQLGPWGGQGLAAWQAEVEAARTLWLAVQAERRGRR